MHKEKYDRVGRMILPLRNNAGRMRLSKVRGAQAILDMNPEFVEPLHALVEGRNEEVSDEQRQSLKKWDLLTRAGGVRGDIKAVLTAGYNKTVAGAIIEEPIDLRNPDHAEAVQWYNDQTKILDDRSEVKARMALVDAVVRQKDGSRLR